MARLPATILALICVQSWLIAVSESSRADQTDQIISRALENYKKDVHPRVEDGNSIKIQISIIPITVNLSWKDDRFSWSPTQHENISSVHFAPTKVWKPDIRSYNSILHEDYEDTDVVAYASGVCYWIPPVNFHTTCELDYTYWPWDEQNCNIILGSWTKSGTELDVILGNQLNSSKIDLENFAPGIWSVSSAVAKKTVQYYGDLSEPWPDVTAKFTLRRISFVDQKLAVLPIVVVAALTLALFWTFPMTRSRILLGGINLLILILILIYLRSRLPSAGGQLPLVVAFTGSLVVMVTVQLMLSLAYANVLVRSDSPPDVLLTPLEGICGKILCLSDIPLVGKIPASGGITIDMAALTIGNTESGTNTSLANNPNHSGWNTLAQALDRVLFILYLAIILIFMSAYFGGASS
ncbi:hypothetical protein TCAL_05233 [Tigriopus californicus]|uniref:Neurotransmitter-gated ion-channel ligand-binding domain-containing protein n=1 Tax=Tigriopus californicus TaxID=6832 RepID=A0A553NVY7_TIGCA|nr:hypothetical protein TCAL_05233 [Tigriopus californicus]|eukprot:TCALIF_05233-PA protein Name:"Similar to acr-7 Acetylcholine receptor subunit alpha-type acr-7 (Caenorhabditis elegans)" AED:0.06 eAED:0.06 QI:73/0.71/0.75/1/0.85/0.87/8/54/409